MLKAGDIVASLSGSRLDALFGFCPRPLCPPTPPNPMFMLHSLPRHAVASLLLLLPAAAQTITVIPGDLLLGFYEVSADGTGVGSNTYVLNLGASSTWRENTTTTVSAGNIKADLDDAFGPGWHENPLLRVGIVGVVGPTDPLTAGDPSRTVYYSQGAAAFAAGATSPIVLSSSQMGTSSTQIKTFSVEMNGKTAGTNPAGAKVATSANNNYAAFLPPLSTTSFGISPSPNTPFGLGNIGSAGSYQVEAALDVYRLLFSTTGADLTAGLSAGNAVVRNGQYIGTFTIDSAGNVRMDRPAPVVTSGYDTWATTNNLTGDNRLPDRDPDADGLANAVEFVVGGLPGNRNDAALAPSAITAGGFLEFVFRRTDDSAYLLPAAESDADLQGVWTAAVNGSAGVTVAVDNNFYDAVTDRVTVRIPIAGGRLFARLRVTVP